ncbi:MAG: hypothetical protein P8077_07860, partial [Gammaproteobacteria bacterium]
MALPYLYPDPAFHYLLMICVKFALLICARYAYCTFVRYPTIILNNAILISVYAFARQKRISICLVNDQKFA